MIGNYLSFQGDIGLLSAVNLFQLIGLASLSGKLVIINSKNTSNFIFTRGMLNYGFSREGYKKIGQILVESRLITTDQLKICLTDQKTSGKTQKLGSIVVGNGFMLKSQILDLFYKQTENALIDTLTWTEGRFNFVNTSPFSDQDIVLEENINGLVLKGLVSLDNNQGTSSLKSGFVK